MKIEKVIPILRIFDEAKAMEFNIGWLGFTIDWQHRYENNAPLYMQISKDGLVLHLSEHHGDATPGAKICIECSGVRELQKELNERNTSITAPAWFKSPRMQFQ